MALALAAIDPKVDYSHEPTTLVVFELGRSEGGTMLTVVESGLDKIPLARRADVFRMNNSGWDQQMENIKSMSPKRRAAAAKPKPLQHYAPVFAAWAMRSGSAGRRPYAWAAPCRSRS